MKKHINAFCDRNFSNLGKAYLFSSKSLGKAYVFILKLFRKACFAAKNSYLHRKFAAKNVLDCVVFVLHGRSVTTYGASY